MKGLEISKSFYRDYGEKLLEGFPEVKDRVAVGLVGEGSECFGYDDEISRDHDFEPCFCMWLTDEDYDKYGFDLERAYARLPKEYEGLNRRLLLPVGGARHGVIKTSEWLNRYLGMPKAPDSSFRWLYIPSNYLATVTNGEVWADKLGHFSTVREQIAQGYPEDVRRKKLAACLALAGQAGQYNYTRILAHGEEGAACFALTEFVKYTVEAIYLLNNKFMPYYKWAFRGMRELRILSDAEGPLSYLLTAGNTAEETKGKAELIEDVCAMVIGELQYEDLTKAVCNNFETHARSVTDTIKDVTLRNMHIMEGA